MGDYVEAPADNRTGRAELRRDGNKDRFGNRQVDPFSSHLGGRSASAADSVGHTRTTGRSPVVHLPGHSRGRLAAVTDTVERVLGRKPISFEEWAAENAAAFR